MYRLLKLFYLCRAFCYSPILRCICGHRPKYMYQSYVFYRIDIPPSNFCHLSICTLLFHAFDYLAIRLCIIVHQTTHKCQLRLFCYLSIFLHSSFHLSKYTFHARFSFLLCTLLNIYCHQPMFLRLFHAGSHQATLHHTWHHYNADKLLDQRLYHQPTTLSTHLHRRV